MSANQPSANDAMAHATAAGQVAPPTAAEGHGLVSDPVDIAADDFMDDSVSELGGSIASSTTSISSYIRDYRVENGRTYHRYKDGKYNIPNDESENDRLDLQHNLCLLTLDNTLGLAPPNKPDSNVKRVLDVGTGSGIWAVEFGEEHPEAEVIGIDLSPSMPQFVPPNVRFEIDDLEEEWIWSRPFDYIHSRMMNSSVGDWKTFAKNAFDNLTPGGFFEINEIGLFPRSDDGTLPPDSSLSKCIDLIYEASIIFGRPYQEPTELVAILESDHKYKELGLWNNANLTSGFEALSMDPLTRAHGWTREEVQVLLVDVRKDLSNQNIHAYWPIYLIHGMKPLEKESE